MTHELIGADVLITDVIRDTHWPVYTIKEVAEDTELIFIDGKSHAYLANDEEFEKFKNGEVAWVHPGEVTAQLIL